jgi:hypothetical protein
MTERTYEQVVAAQQRKEIDAFEADPIAQQQAHLDWWVQTQRDDAAAYRQMMRELNPVGLLVWD